MLDFTLGFEICKGIRIAEKSFVDMSVWIFLPQTNFIFFSALIIIKTKVLEKLFYWIWIIIIIETVEKTQCWKIIIFDE